jgi:hypothetical protein
MPFSADDRALLLSVKGVGPTVITRLEQVGVKDLADLAGRDAEAICIAASAAVGSTCWRNSPQAKGAIAAAIAAAQARLAELA